MQRAIIMIIGVVTTEQFMLTFLRLVLISYPAITAVPEVMARSPVSILNVVVLPAPLYNPNKRFSS